MVTDRRSQVVFMNPTQIQKAMKDLAQEMSQMDRDSSEYDLANSDLQYMYGVYYEAIYG